jgi:hypothetical protein
MDVKVKQDLLPSMLDLTENQPENQVDLSLQEDLSETLKETEVGK